MNIPSKFIREYRLQPHPEGGWYKETYKSSEQISSHALPVRFGGDRPYSTAIYFLLEQGNFSSFHRIKSDECWHFYTGGPLQIFEIAEDGNLQVITLGNDVSKGHRFQYIVRASRWFASRPAPESEFCFVGCTVSPGFDFADFELADSAALSALYPPHASIIRELCR
jgi:predicted cupin superfamily sugar epimerase